MPTENPDPTKKSGPSPQERVDQIISELAPGLEALTRRLISQAGEFGELIERLKLQDGFAPFLNQVGALITVQNQIAGRLGDVIAKSKEEDLLSPEPVTQITEDFVARVRDFRSALDEIAGFEQELKGLIGIPGETGTSFDSLVADYMEQIKVLGGIVKQFGVKVQACEACMDIEKCEALIKSYEEVLKNWGDLVKSVEDLLNSKRDLLYSLAKNREELLKSYEDLTKSALEVEDLRLDLLNKPLRKSLEFAKTNEDLAKSAAELAKSQQELSATAAKNTEDLIKSYAEIAKAAEDLIKSIKCVWISKPEPLYKCE